MLWAGFERPEVNFQLEPTGVTVENWLGCFIGIHVPNYSIQFCLLHAVQVQAKMESYAEMKDKAILQLGEASLLLLFVLALQSYYTLACVRLARISLHLGHFCLPDADQAQMAGFATHIC